MNDRLRAEIDELAARHDLNLNPLEIIFVRIEQEAFATARERHMTIVSDHIECPREESCHQCNALYRIVYAIEKS